MNSRVFANPRFSNATPQHGGDAGSTVADATPHEGEGESAHAREHAAKGEADTPQANAAAGEGDGTLTEESLEAHWARFSTPRRAVKVASLASLKNPKFGF